MGRETYAARIGQRRMKDWEGLTEDWEGWEGLTCMPARMKDWEGLTEDWEGWEGSAARLMRALNQKRFE